MLTLKSVEFQESLRRGESQRIVDKGKSLRLIHRSVLWAHGRCASTFHEQADRPRGSYGILWRCGTDRSFWSSSVFINNAATFAHSCSHSQVSVVVGWKLRPVKAPLKATAALFGVNEWNSKKLYEEVILLPSGSHLTATLETPSSGWEGTFLGGRFWSTQILLRSHSKMSSSMQKVRLLNKLASSSQRQPKSCLKYSLGTMK